MIAFFKQLFAKLFGKTETPVQVQDTWYPSSPKEDASKPYNPNTIQEDYYFGSPDGKSTVAVAPDLVTITAPEITILPVPAPVKAKNKPRAKKVPAKAPAKPVVKAPAKVQKPVVKAPAKPVVKAPAKAPAPAKKAAPQRSVKK